MLSSVAGIVPLDQIGGAIPIVVSLILLEGMLSVDNVLVMAAMVSHLPEKERAAALRLGILGAYAFRGFFLFFANWLSAHQWVKLVGAAYLLYLMCKNLGSEGKNETESRSTEGHGFLSTVVMMEIANLNFSWDNILAAAAIDKRFWVICTGVGIGILAMRFVAGLFVKLIEKFPILEQVAFVLLGFIGFQLVGEDVFAFNMTSVQKFGCITGIVVAGIVYGQVGFVHKVFKPIFHGLGIVMGMAAYIFDLLIMSWVSVILDFVIVKPITKVYNLIFPKKKGQGEDESDTK